MDKFILVQHAPGAPGMRMFGLGPRFMPRDGMRQLKTLFDNNAFWAKGRSLKDLKLILSKSTLVVSIWGQQKLIGFGRATSDEIFRATLWDIVIDKNFQNLGLGEKIVASILSHPLISKVEKIYLMTTFGNDFYLKMNFKKEDKQNLMVLKQLK
tara:strand:- start:2942 stop:3403 length:462 start_codon:yes stop_codon:yes gene_type:complete